MKPLEHDKRAKLNSLYNILRDSSSNDFDLYKRTYIETLVEFMREEYDISRHWTAYRKLTVYRNEHAL